MCKIEIPASRLAGENKLLRQEVKQLQADNEKLKAEFVAVNPECCWRKCWACGKVQIHSSDITPGVLCRFCGSQDTRLLREKTKNLKGE